MKREERVTQEQDEAEPAGQSKAPGSTKKSKIKKKKKKKASNTSESGQGAAAVPRSRNGKGAALPDEAQPVLTPWEEFLALVPQDTIPAGYICTEEGVRTDDGGLVAKSPMGVAAKSVREDGSDARILIAFLDMDGELRKEHIDRTLVGAPQLLLKFFLDRGARVRPSEAAACANYVADFVPRQSLLLVTQPGWVGDPFKSPCFAYGNVLLGKAPGGQRLHFEPRCGTRVHEALRRRNKLEQWKKHVAKEVRRHPLIIFAICAALAAPLARLAKVEALGFHFWTQSSSGKTTLLQIIASVFGKADATGGTPSLVHSWNSTTNALEILAYSSNDLPVLLDELKAGTAEEAGKIIYMMSQGQGKNRMSAGLKMSEQYRWSVIMFSTGETPVRQAMEAARKQVHAGQEVRMISIPVEEDDYGEDAGSFVNSLKQNVLRFYGRPGREFVKELIKLLKNPEWTQAAFTETLEAYAESLKDRPLTPTRERVTNFFGLVLMAGDFARQMGILPYTEAQILDAVKTVHQRWLAASVQLTETERAVQVVQDHLVRHASRFAVASKERSPMLRPKNQMGWRVSRGSGLSQREYFVLDPATFKELCARAGADAPRVGNWLRDRGLLHCGEEKGSKNQFSWTPPGATKGRFYFVAARLTELDLEVEQLKVTRK